MGDTGSFESQTDFRHLPNYALFRTSYIVLFLVPIDNGAFVIYFIFIDYGLRDQASHVLCTFSAWCISEKSIFLIILQVIVDKSF